ncbi:MAG TPA: hypothetical protein VLV83_12735 [Acidobacteriota bacterium]|nr:hypothetical protein [Acidobacteriota bacterium]
MKVAEGWMLGALLTLFWAAPAWAQEANGDQQPRFRVDVRASQYIVRVFDEEDRVVRGLVKDDFLLLEEGRPRPVEDLEEEPKANVSLGILLDIGSTMSREKILLGRQVMHRLIHLLEPRDEILLGVYSDEVDFVSELSSDRYHLVESIELIGSGARPGKWRRLGQLFMSQALTGYAVDKMLLRLKKCAHPSNKAVLVVSAGFGGIGEATLDHLHKAGTRFFGVSLGNRAGDMISLGGDQAARKRIVRETGGWAYSEKEALEKIEQMRDALSHYYLLTYIPADEGADLTERKIEIRLPARSGLRLTYTRRTSSSSSFY